LNLLGLTISDNCTPDIDLVVTSSDAVAGTCPVVVTRTYRIADECGNFNEYIQTIEVDDSTAPVITGSIATSDVEDCAASAVPAAVSTVADLEAMGLTIADVCTADADLVVTSSDAVAGTCPIVITRTYTITDLCGNASTATATIRINDTTDPTASNPAPINVECIGDVPVPDILVVTDEADNCTAIPVVAFESDVSDGNTCPEVITRTYSVTDDCLNQITVIQLITINDITNPTFTAPADITISKDASCSYDADPSITGDVTNEADNCSTGLNATYSDVEVAGTCEGEVIITRTWSLTDDCGLTTTHDQIITVADNVEAPTFTAPADITISKDATCNYDASVSITGDVTDEADNCTTTLNATYSDAIAVGSCEGEVIITRTWSLTDDCGLTTTHVQIITVADNLLAPTFTAPADITISKDANCNYNADPSITGMLPTRMTTAPRF
jgi:hypothetical protein